MRLALITAASVISLGVLTAACATKPAPEKASTSVADIQGGQTDSTDKFAMGICIIINGQCQALCSGALILPNVVATARHCVSQLQSETVDCTTNPTFGALYDGFVVTSDTTMSQNSKWVKATAYVPKENAVCGDDIAMLVLDTPVAATDATPITPNIQKKMWDSSYARSFTAIGYGRTSPAGSSSSSSSGDPNGGAGTRRILANMPLECIPGSTDIPCDAASGMNANEFYAGSGVCQGDSGSSAYESNSFTAGKPMSFGVLSRGGQSQDGQTCEGSLYSRFDAHRNFVLDVAKVASKNWTLYPEPTWTAVDNSPSGVGPGTDTGMAPPGSTSGGSSSSSSSSGDTGATKSKDGVSCKYNGDCASGKCVIDAEGEEGDRICAMNCEDDATVCKSGFVCSQHGACIKDIAGPTTTPSNPNIKTDVSGTLPMSAAPKTETVTTTACNFSAGGAGSTSSFWLVGLGLAISALRRRRSS
jgi:MYXO-CTERM domain-containing protein